MMTQTVATPSTPPTTAALAATPAVLIDSLTHRYAPPPKGRAGDAASGGGGGGRPPALDNLSLRIEAGITFAILGPNGGGKTTLFRILTTLLHPTQAQTVQLLGVDVARDPHSARRQLGVVFQAPSLDGRLTAYENLLHQGHLYGLRGPMLRARIDELLSRFHLGDRANEYVEHFSGGLRRRVEIAKALLHRPPLLLLDEPSTGLDPAARMDLWELLTDLCRGQHVTVVFTTHFLEEADRCDRIALLHQGRLVAQDTPAALKAAIGGHVITLEFAPESDLQALCTDITQRWGPWSEQARPRVVEGKLRLEHGQGPAVAAQIAAAYPGRVTWLQVGQPTLDDVFFHLTGRRLHWAGSSPAAAPPE